VWGGVGVRWVGRLVVGKLIGVVAVMSVLLGARWVAFSVQDLGSVSATARSTGNDALWLGHAWVEGGTGATEVARLAAELSGTGIRDLFVHIGPLSSDGSLDPGLRPQARWLVTAIHQALPGVRLLGWMGDMVTPQGGLDLESAETRGRIVAAVGSVLGDGFDGVHFDFEPVGDADPGYLALLDEVGPVVHGTGAGVVMGTGTGRMLSVSAEQVEPVPGGRWALEAVVGHGTWWSSAYLRQVASRVDQVAIMSYDTALWSASAYSGFVRDETGAALAAVPRNVALLIGVPAYQTNDLGHDAAAETVSAAIRGVRLALPAGTPTDRAVGVALYADFAATPADWAAYRSDWVGPSAVLNKSRTR
jgi:hypothetical protein